MAAKYTVRNRMRKGSFVGTKQDHEVHKRSISRKSGKRFLLKRSPPIIDSKGIKTFVNYIRSLLQEG